MKKRVLSLLLALAMVLSLLPVTVFAVDGHDGQVRVRVENSTWNKADGAPWEGTLVDEWITLKDDSTMMSCVKYALEKNHYSYETASSPYGGEYLGEVNGLAEVDGGAQSGWMGTLNDWFVNASFSAFTAKNGTLAAGDEIRVLYTKTGYGADIGGDWSTKSNTALSALSFSSGTLSPAFDKDTLEYTLTLTEPANVTVAVTAANKCNQVYLTVGETSYRRSASIPMEDGTVLTLRCGDAEEGTENTPAVVPTTYTVTVKAGQRIPKANVTVRSQAAGAYLHGIETVEVSGDLAESYGFTDNVEGVSALDVLVKAHELVFGKDFTPQTASSYLSVGSTGWVSLTFGLTDSFGFFVNEGFPNDGTASASGGYNGTFVTNTAVHDGDTVDFFLYQDGKEWSDYYTWIDAPAAVVDGEKVNVTVKGFYAVSAYLYKDGAALKAAAKALEGVRLGWLEPATGAVTAIQNAVTDENGTASFVADKAATGYLVALSNSDDEVYAIMNPTAKIAVHTKVNVEFNGLHNAQLSDLKVYSYQNGVKGATDLLADLTPEPDGYKLKYATTMLPGDYLVEGYDANGDFNGSIVVTVGEEDCAFVLQRANQIYATNSGWKVGTDYTIEYVETAPDGTLRKTALGTANNYGTVYTSAIFLEGDTLKVTLKPIGDKTNDYLPITVTKTGSETVDKGALSFSASIPQGLDVKITAPAGSTVVAGTFGNYYFYTFIDPVQTTDNGDGTMTASFRVPTTTSQNHFLRVQNPDGVTYWSFDRWTAAQNITVTRDDLHMDDDISASTVYRFKNNVYDRADVYLNINRQGYKNLSVGEHFELDVFRNWQAIEGFMNAKIALPDVHYQVLDLNGKPSDLLTVTPDAYNSSLATVTANREGTAIVLVTYDAMTHKQAQSSTDSKVLSAIWPESTGVFVVSVGADGSAIATNMKMDRTGSAGTLTDDKLALDAEHDILFYLGTAGASYTFTPESGCTVSIARSTVGKAMTFSGFTTEGVNVDAKTGAVTITGLTTGRHIVRIEKDGVATYQVITARQVRYDLLDADGNVLPENTEFNPGDTVTVQFHDLLSPKEKLSGVFNQNFLVYYHDDDGHSFQGVLPGPFGLYDFNGNPERQKFTLTIPENTTGVTYVLNGSIKIGGFSGVPTHRGVSYTKGIDPQFGTASAGVMTRLPELVIKLEGYAVAETERLIDAIGEVTLESEDAITSARAAYDALTEEQQKQVGNYKVLTAAEAALAALKKAEQAEIDAVEAKIDAIGDVTLNSEKAITAAREAYEALTDAQKARVENYDTLIAAEQKLAELKLAALLKHIYTTTGDYLTALGTPSVGSIGGEWMALGLARSGRTVPDGYYDAVVEYVKAHADQNERLHRSRSTDNSRIILALTAIGRDVTNVGGHNLLKGLDSMAYIQKQGINGPVFALIALDSHVYPVSGDVTREKLVQAILDAALANGGWALDGDLADADMTAMAIQALAPYYAGNETIKAAVDKALTVLSGLQLADGGFASWGNANCESNAQVLVALTALGIDPAEDSRFAKNGKTVLDALAGYYVEGGGFKHIANGELDGMATEQGYYALAAYYRLMNKQSGLYDMRDVAIKFEPAKPTTPVTPTTPTTGDSGVAVWFIVLSLSVFALAAALVLARKKFKTE